MTPDDLSPHWYEFPYDPASETGAVFEGDSVTIYFKDGQRGDDDLSKNGILADPGGPAIVGADNTPAPIPDAIDTAGAGGSSGGGGGCFIDSIFNHLP